MEDPKEPTPGLRPRRTRPTRIKDLIRCPACLEVVSRQGGVCGNCGQPFRRQGVGGGILALAVGVVVAIGILVLGARFLKAPAGSSANVATGPSAPSPEIEAAAPTPATSTIAPAPVATRSVPPPAASSIEADLSAVVRVEGVGIDVGSGFLIADDSSVVTALHLVDGASSIKVSLGDGTAAAAKLVGRSEAGDLALLKSDLPIGRGRMTVGSTAPLTPGQPVRVVGYPLGTRKPTVTRGVVSAASMMLPGIPTPLIQIDASINAGISGAPMLDDTGHVVGVVVGGLPGTDGMNYAVSASYVASLSPGSTPLADSVPPSRLAAPVTVTILGAVAMDNEVLIALKATDATIRNEMVQMNVKWSTDMDKGECNATTKPREVPPNNEAMDKLASEGGAVVVVSIPCPTLALQMQPTMTVTIQAKKATTVTQLVGWLL